MAVVIACIQGTLFLRLDNDQVKWLHLHLSRTDRLSNEEMNFLLNEKQQQQPQGDAQTKMGLLFAILCYFTFNSLQSVPQLFGERSVFYMQRDAKYYTTLPYLLASAAAEVCSSLLLITPPPSQSQTD